MKIKSITVGEICSTSLLYFDSEKTQECAGVCAHLGVDYLPLVGSKSYAEYNSGKFVESLINPEISVSKYNQILEDEFSIKLSSAKHNVLFVFDGQVLCGVVHISDLNRNVVINALQNDFLSFERNLRQFYLLNGVTNQSIIDFFDYRAKKGNDHFKTKYEEYSSDTKIEELRKFGELQHFYLNDLLHFGNSSLSSKLFVTNEIDSRLKQPHDAIINSLRNSVMHAKDSIDTKTNLNLNSERNLNEFKIKVNVFVHAFEKLDFELKSNSNYIKAIKLDNFSKLQIIGEHFPNAIEFFIK
jgi:hypothetical protein